MKHLRPDQLHTVTFANFHCVSHEPHSVLKISFIPNHFLAYDVWCPQLLKIQSTGFTNLHQIYWSNLAANKVIGTSPVSLTLEWQSWCYSHFMPQSFKVWGNEVARVQQTRCQKWWEFWRNGESNYLLSVKALDRLLMKVKTWNSWKKEKISFGLFAWKTMKPTIKSLHMVHSGIINL